MKPRPALNCSTPFISGTLLPGAHRVRVEAEGQFPWISTVDVKPGQELGINLTEANLPKRRRWPTYTAITAGALAGASLAAGGFLGVLSQVKPSGATRAAAQDDLAQKDRYARSANVAFIARRRARRHDHRARYRLRRGHLRPRGLRGAQEREQAHGPPSVGACGTCGASAPERDSEVFLTRRPSTGEWALGMAAVAIGTLMTRSETPPLFTTYLLVAATGCVGSVGGGAEPTAGSGPDQGSRRPPSTLAGSCVEAAPAISPMRRLSNDEHARTVALLLGDEPPLTAKLPEPEQSSPIVSALWAEGTMAVAEELAARVVKKLGAFAACAPASGEDACATRFIESFGERAYRRPLLPAEVTRLLAMYRVGRNGSDFAHGIEVVVRTMLQSPHFLYRLELGDGRGAAAERVRLTPYEVASRLSYALWGSMPDEPLLAAAADGRLDTPDRIREQARRLMGDARGHLALRRFHEEWLGLAAVGTPLTGPLASKDRSVYKELNEALVEDMRRDVTSFLDYMLKEQGGRLEALLTAPIAFTSSRLAGLYGTPAPPPGVLARAHLDPARRSGILTNAGFLAVHTKADDRAHIHRGVVIRESLLCAAPPAPPGNAPDTPEVVLDNPACKGCHRLINPIGAGFAHYDGIGRWRSSAEGRPIDATGELVGTEDVDGGFVGVPALARRLLGSGQVKNCVVTRFVESALAGSEDACAHRKLADAYSAAGMDIRELAIALTATEGFAYRRPAPGEAQP